MNHIKIKYLGVVILLASVISTANADVLLIDEVRASKSRSLPDNGITMQAVEAHWGTPDNRSGAVGDPPITRWEYKDYSVYFEHDRVITSVLHSGAITE